MSTVLVAEDRQEDKVLGVSGGTLSEEESVRDLNASSKASLKELTGKVRPQEDTIAMRSHIT